MSPAQSENGRGYIIPVGGAEEKIGNVAILRRFVALGGNGDGRIAIIPTASEVSETGGRYEKLFLELGAGAAKAVPIKSRGDCDRAGQGSAW